MKVLLNCLDNDGWVLASTVIDARVTSQSIWSDPVTVPVRYSGTLSELTGYVMGSHRSFAVPLGSCDIKAGHTITLDWADRPVAVLTGVNKLDQ